jgi:hypothetical protein
MSPEIPGGKPEIELAVLGEIPNWPLMMVLPVEVIAVLAMMPKGNAVPRSI